MTTNIELDDFGLQFRKKPIMNIRLTIVTLLAVCTALWAMPRTARGDIFASINITSSTDPFIGSVYDYTAPETYSSFASGFSRPHGLAFHAGNLFFTSTKLDDAGNWQGTIFKVAPDGTMSTFTTGFPPNFFLNPVVFDSAGDLYVTANNLSDPNTASTIYKVNVTSSPQGMVRPFGLQSDCNYLDPSLGNCSVPGDSRGLAFDSAGYLFVSDNIDNRIYKFTPQGDARTVFVDSGAFTSTESPIVLAFDGSGNLFASSADNIPGDGEILKFTLDGTAPDGTKTTIATGLSDEPRGIAFDDAGNLFVAEVPVATTGDILKLTPGGTGTVNDLPWQTTGGPGIVPVSGVGVDVFASGIGRTRGNGGPEYLAFAPGPVTPPSLAVALTSPNATAPLTTTVTKVDQNSLPPPPSNFELSGSNLAFDITTTTTPTPPIIVAFSPVDPSLQVLHYEFDPVCSCNDWQNKTIYPSNPAPNTVYASVNSLSPFLLVVAKEGCHSATSISSNFNGTAISTGNYIWFNGVLKASGLGSTPVTIRFTGQTITSANFTLSVPDASVTFDPAATSATTTFNGSMWVTRVPSQGLAGNTFLSGVGYPVPVNLPGGIKNVTWNGTVAIDTSGVSVNWKWGTAIYKSFSSSYPALGVKPVDNNNASQYKNSDHAGTPENFKWYVIGGATGGGGSNYTGGYSGTASVGPCP